MNDKLNELKISRNELLHNIENYRNEITRAESEGITNVGRYNELQGTLNSYQNKLKQVDESISQLENAAGNAQEELTNMFDSFMVGGKEWSLRALSKGESEYQVISAFFQQFVGDQAEHFATILHSYKSENETLSEGLNELSRIKGELDELHKENLELSDRFVDAESKRDAAARELSQASEEITRLKADNENLRNRLENVKPVATNATANLAEVIRELEAKKPAIYGLRWKSENRQTHYIATLAETDEEIEIPFLEKGAYRVLEGEELARFREEQAEKELERLAQETIHHAQIADEVTPPSLSYPNAEVSSDSTNGTMVPEAKEVTREEFDALVQRVAHIELTVRGVA